jgi:hypothetical protein
LSFSSVAKSKRLQIITVGDEARGNQALALGERLGLIEALPLFERADRNLALASVLGPGTWVSSV